MKTIFRLFCGWMAIALAACTGDELSRETDKQQPDDTRVVSVKAYTPGEQPESKLAFEEKDDGSLGVSWASGDAFTAVVGDEKVTFTYDTEKNQFTATLPEGVTLADGVKAYYPAYTGEYTTDLSAQTGKPDGKVTYMEGTYSESGNSFRFGHSTAILKASFAGLPDDAAVSSIKVSASPYTISIPFSPGLNLASGIYIYLPGIAKDGQVMFVVKTTAGKVYTATRTVKPAAGIETGKVYNAAITLTEAVCNMPEGEVFNAAIKAIQGFESVTSIVFEAQSDETGGTRISSGLAYAKVMADGTTLKIYTVANEFVFNANCFDMFNELSAITSIDFGDCVNTSKVEDMSYMFCRCTSLTSLDLSSFDTKNVTMMYGMFFDCTSLASLDLSSFNTSKVTDMNGMFGGCSSLTSLDLSRFNTSKVKDMNGMFYECRGLTELDLCSFDFSAVADFEDMFYALAQNVGMSVVYVYVKNEDDKTKLGNAPTGIDIGYAEIKVKE